jgi:CBS domain containing-hemolysin-like protein
VQRDQRSWLVDGTLSLADFHAGVGISDPAADTPRPYHTVAGPVMNALGRVPVGWRSRDGCPI